MELVFKRATEQDWETVSSLEKSVSQTKYYYPITKEEEVKKYIKNSHVFLIQKGGEAIGTISYELKKDGTAEENGMTVRPDYQNQGIATEAMAFLVGNLKGRRIILAVHPRNTPAIKLYFKFGFYVHGWKDNYYGDGEPRLVMVKD